MLDAFLLRAMAVARLGPVARTTAPAAAPPARTGPSPSPAGGRLPRLPAVRLGRPVAGAARAVVALLDRRLGRPPDATEPRARREASGLVAAYLQWHLERGLRTLPLVER